MLSPDEIVFEINVANGGHVWVTKNPRFGYMSRIAYILPLSAAERVFDMGDVEITEGWDQFAFTERGAIAKALRMFKISRLDISKNI